MRELRRDSVLTRGNAISFTSFHLCHRETWLHGTVSTMETHRARNRWQRFERNVAPHRALAVKGPDLDRPLIRGDARFVIKEPSSTATSTRRTGVPSARRASFSLMHTTAASTANTARRTKGTSSTVLLLEMVFAGYQAGMAAQARENWASPSCGPLTHSGNPLRTGLDDSHPARRTVRSGHEQ